MFVEYANFLDDWRREVKRISNVLPIDLDTGDGVAVEEFLEPNLRRQRDGGRVTEPFGTDWLSVAYEDLSTAARDDPWDQSELDRILAQYEMSERGFRMAHDDFHYAFDNLRFRFSRKFKRPPLAERDVTCFRITRRVPVPAVRPRLRGLPQPRCC